MNPIKERLCRHFETKGFCLRGSSCDFAHGLDDLNLPPASIYYGIERPSRQSPKPPAGLGIDVIDWNVLDISTAAPDASKPIEGNPRYSGFARKTPTSLGTTVSKLSTRDVTRGSKLQYTRKRRSTVPTIPKGVSHDASTQTTHGALQTRLEPDRLHCLPIPYTRRALQASGSHCLLQDAPSSRHSTEAFKDKINTLC